MACMGTICSKKIYYILLPNSAANEPISQSSFWSHSWLNFGVEIIKEKVLSHVLERHIAGGIGESTLRTTEVELPVPIDRPTGTISDDSQVQVVLDNPCGQADHEHDHSSKHYWLCYTNYFLTIF